MRKQHEQERLLKEKQKKDKLLKEKQEQERQIKEQQQKEALKEKVERDKILKEKQEQQIIIKAKQGKEALKEQEDKNKRVGHAEVSKQKVQEQARMQGIPRDTYSRRPDKENTAKKQGHENFRAGGQYEEVDVDDKKRYVRKEAESYAGWQQQVARHSTGNWEPPASAQRNIGRNAAFSGQPVRQADQFAKVRIHGCTCMHIRK